MPRNLTSTVLICGALTLALAACDDSQKSAVQPPLPIKAQVVSASEHALSVAFTGEIKARVQSELAFRFAGRIAKRFVDVGDHIHAGQVLATLEAREQTAEVDSADAGVKSAEATLRQATAAYDRQKALLTNGFTTQTNYDNALQTLQAARASLDAARSALGTAKEQFANTTLIAEAAGVVTARNAEAGQVVEAAQSVFTVSLDGERDAVFDVFEGLLAHQASNATIEVALVSDPAVKTTGSVREIAPTVDPSTGTVRIKVAIDKPPAAMTLGAAVTGAGHFQAAPVFRLPSSAFFTENGKPAVWTIDPRSHVASMKSIVIDSYRSNEILIRSGLKAGDIVATAGAQLLRPGQTVKPLITGEQARAETAP